MNITVNGGPESASGTLSELLAARLGDPRPHGIAVAVNGDVVPRGEWAAWRLREADAVEIVTAVQGG